MVSLIAFQTSGKEHKPVKLEIDEENGCVIKEEEASEDEVEEFIGDMEEDVKIRNDMSSTKQERKHNWAITIFTTVGGILLTVIAGVLLMYKSPTSLMTELNREQINNVELSVQDTSRDLQNLRTEIADDIRNIDGKVDRIYNLLLEIKQGE